MIRAIVTDIEGHQATFAVHNVILFPTPASNGAFVSAQQYIERPFSTKSRTEIAPLKPVPQRYRDAIPLHGRRSIKSTALKALQGVSGARGYQAAATTSHLYRCTPGAGEWKAMGHWLYVYSGSVAHQKLFGYSDEG